MKGSTRGFVFFAVGCFLSVFVFAFTTAFTFAFTFGFALLTGLTSGFAGAAVEDAYQRRGLARAMLTAGLDRLAKRGARRLKVGYQTDVARDLYVGAGFRVTSTDRSFSRRRPVSTA